MKTLEFHKMEGTGNDFVVVDNRNYNFALNEIINFTPKLCDRKFGIGADGLLVLQKSSNPNADYTMIYRNADGSDAGMCGNGGRCLALFASQNGFPKKHSFNVHDNIYKAEVSEDEVSVHFPVKVKPVSLKLDGEEFLKADAATEHLVKFVQQSVLDDENALLKTGRKFRMHKEMNPPGTNVNFVQLLDNQSIKVQTYERGVENLTLACGTGALAAAIAAHNVQENRELHSTYEVHMKGGLLKATFDYAPQSNIYQNLILTGPAHFVFKGIVTLR
ncbi:MAG: diaminopimelate epimerase [Balneolaceae bacterium]